MSRPALRALAPFFAVGLALGATAWLLSRRASAPPAPPAAAVAPAQPTLPPWAWRESLRPPPLPAATLAVAIDAWLALRAPHGSPADAATRLDTLRALLARLSAQSFPRLLDPLFASADFADRPLLTIAFTAWTELDAPAAARWVATLAESPDWYRDKLATLAAHAWVALDPLAVSTWACALPDEELAESIARIVLPALARQDPRRAYDLASSRDKHFLDAVLNDLLEALAESDPASALRAFGSGRFQPGGGGFRAVRTPLTRWVRHDPAAALRWLAGETQADASSWFDALWHLAKNDSVMAQSLLATLQAHPDIPRNQASLAELFSYWGARDSDAALQWLAKIQDASLRAQMLEKASRSPDLDHPEKGLPFALARADSRDRTLALSNALSEWATRAPSAALAWIHQHADDPGVKAATVQTHAAILATIALTEPATAIAEYQALQDPQTKIAARRTISDAWAKTDPGAAHRWRMSQNEAFGYPPYDGDSRIFHAWSRQDPVAALRWAEQVAEPYSRGIYLKSLATSGVEAAPRAATADLYAQLADPALRLEYVTKHLRDWLAKDRPAAKAWLEKSDALTAEQAAALLAAP